jgi:hypothetical protein
MLAAILSDEFEQAFDVDGLCQDGRAERQTVVRVRRLNGDRALGKRRRLVQLAALTRSISSRSSLTLNGFSTT